MQIELTREQKEVIEQHGESTYPHECCGLLFGRVIDKRKQIEDVRPIENQNDESPENRYLIPPEEILKGEKYAREEGFDVVGYFHSHPDVVARPSEFDREHAWPWYSYIIVSVVRGKAAEIRSWQLRDDRASFDEEEILLQKPELTFAEED